MITPHIQPPDDYQPRRELKPGAADPGRNARLEEFRNSLASLLCIKTSEPAILGQEIEAGERRRIRNLDPYAIRTIVTNLGDHPVTIYEAGYIVGIVGYQEEIEIPMGGKLSLDAEAQFKTFVAVTTYRREVCGVPFEVTEPDHVPEGSQWL